MAHIHRIFVLPSRGLVDEDATPARPTEFMHPLPRAKRVSGQVIVTLVEYDVLGWWVDQKVTIAVADGAVALVDCVVRERRCANCVNDGGALAVCVVWDKGCLGIFSGKGIRKMRVFVFCAIVFPICESQFQLVEINVLEQSHLNHEIRHLHEGSRGKMHRRTLIAIISLSPIFASPPTLLPHVLQNRWTPDLFPKLKSVTLSSPV